MVTLKIRQADKELVESLLATAQNDYKKKIQKDVHLNIEKESFLPQDTCGGVEIHAARGRIKVSAPTAFFVFECFRISMIWLLTTTK